MNTTTPTTNTMGSGHRYVTGDDGKDYIVAPVAMLVPGVHHGSNGPLYYPAAELAKNPDAWDGKPVTVGHPPNGYVPGRTTVVGTIKNARYDGKLRAEVWLDAAALVWHAEELYHAIENGGTVEVSTGLYTTNDPTPGTGPDGKHYDALAHSYQPDHLAILGEQPGACSVAAGCGLPVANADTEPVTPTKEEPMPYEDELLPMPVMNFGNPETEPVVNADDYETLADYREARIGLPLPTMNFGCGCGGDKGHDTAPANDEHHSHQHTTTNATGGGDGPLQLPSTL